MNVIAGPVDLDAGQVSSREAPPEDTYSGAVRRFIALLKRKSVSKTVHFDESLWVPLSCARLQALGRN